ncbi:alkaline phosphatase family protein [Enhygromyxa salina]|uniref:Phospholipase C 2 n=1 Tax=Enhygromyxa salina TaxID=215803 RepID=A0A2S9YNC3_9BACT|nr:alkaline phosphatase family protein [Enhygromyxa salina]PRQ06582.1 Phospholipase C 2 precursor [Enhygromyxa salina]
MGWINIAETEQQVRLASSATLTKSDLDVLCDPTQWMTDALINFGVKVYGDEPLGELHDNVRWIDPATVRLGKEGNAEAFDASLGRDGVLGAPRNLITAPQLPGDVNVILFPVNKGDTHWSLLAFFKAGRSFVHYDSLHPANNDAAQALIDKLHAKGYLPEDVVFESPVEVARQEDGYNCGVYVVSFARMIMNGGARPGGDALATVTSDTCDLLRLQMLQSLQPLVSYELPMPEHRPLPSSETDYTPALVTTDEAEQLEDQAEVRQVAVKRLKECLAKEAPVKLNTTAQCEKAEVSNLIVVLRSDDIPVLNLKTAKVTFAIGSQRFTRTAAQAGEEWVTALKLQIKSGITVDVTAAVTPDLEFVANQKQGAQDIGTGEEKTLEFTFTPKPPRRMFAKFVFSDPPKPGRDEEVQPTKRPFPADFEVELVFDEGQGNAMAAIRADGQIVSADDEQLGVQIPHAVKKIWPRFPGISDDRVLQWETDSEADAPTTLVDPTAEEEVDQTRSGPVRKGRWGPTPDPDWVLPDQHKNGTEEFHQQVDVSELAETIGSEEAPLEYLLENMPQTWHMNGHPIEHVVVLMLENRGFDHFMGYLYEGSDKPSNSYPASPKGKHAGLRTFEGMEGLNPEFPYEYEWETRGPRSRSNPLGPKVKQTVRGRLRTRKGARACNMPRTNPHEDFIHIFQQMYGNDVVANTADMKTAAKRDPLVKSGGEYKRPAMTGYAHNFVDGIRHHRGYKNSVFISEDMISEILDIYLPDQLPVMSGLARHYAVSDLWFCSVPSQTNTNRAYWVAGSAAGEVTNAYYPAYPKVDKVKELHADQMPEGIADKMLHRRNLFTVCDENEIEWKYYWSSHWPPAPIKGNYFKAMFPQYGGKSFNKNVPLIAQFYTDAENGTLPPVSYIEPIWGGGAHWDAGMMRAVGNEFHPVQDMTNGEFFVKKVYEAIANSPKWDTTLLVITFDENGGTYDHFPPWAAVPSGREPEPGAEKPLQFGFEFDCYGVRVPTLLIGKHIKPGTIFRSNTDVPLDHTSIIATILKWAQIPKSEWRLGDRVDGAPTFDEVLDGAGDDDEDRLASAPGMLAFDAARKSRIEGTKPLTSEDTIRLRYVGNKWTTPPPDALDYIGGPTTSMNSWYPICTQVKGDALEFKITSESGEVKAGDKVVIEVTSGPATGYSLAVPTKGAKTVYLYKGSNPSRWVIWLINDRVEGVPIHAGDEVILFAECYLPEKLKGGGSYNDPYQRLTVETGSATTRYVKWRAGEWDIWKLEG